MCGSGCDVRPMGPHGRPFTQEDYDASSEEVRKAFDSFVRLSEAERAGVESGLANPSPEFTATLEKLFSLGLGDLCTVRALMNHWGIVYENGHVQFWGNATG